MDALVVPRGFENELDVFDRKSRHFPCIVSLPPEILLRQTTHA
jgi:hypothetical protein